MSGIQLQEVTKVFPGGFRAVDEVSLEVEQGEFVVLVGPSGCGKTTLLRMVAGLEVVSRGRIWINDQEVTWRAPGKRDVAMVFQNYALYPHMDVRRNLSFGLRVRGARRAEVRQRVEEVARMLSLEDLLSRRPSALSGGQRQRVAMGRAIVRRPAAFLMDEPLSNLDAKLRVGMRGELARLHRRLGVTTIYVTHDQVEAMTLGTRVAVMNAGTLQQVDAPQELYRRPANLFVAAFIGSPAMNLVEAEIADDGTLSFGGHSIPLPTAHRPPHKGRVVAGIRPENFEDATFGEEEWPTIEVSVDVVEELGAETDVLFTPEASRVGVGSATPPAEAEMLLAGEADLGFTARLDPRTSCRAGERLRLAIDTSQIHYFDPETGVNLLAAQAAAV